MGKDARGGGGGPTRGRNLEEEACSAEDTLAVLGMEGGRRHSSGGSRRWVRGGWGRSGEGFLGREGCSATTRRSAATVFGDEAGAAVEWLVVAAAWLGLRVRFCKILGRTGGAQADDQRNLVNISISRALCPARARLAQLFFY